MDIDKAAPPGGNGITGGGGGGGGGTTIGGGATLTGGGEQAATALTKIIALKCLTPRRIDFSPITPKAFQQDFAAKEKTSSPKRQRKWPSGFPTGHFHIFKLNAA